MDWSSSCGSPGECPAAASHGPRTDANGRQFHIAIAQPFLLHSFTITKVAPFGQTKRHYNRLRPNGLAAAILLARAGHRVTVHEAAVQVGGGARSAALTLPGFIHDVCSAVHPMAVCSPCFEQFPLAAHGLTWVHPAVPLAHPLDDGSAVLLERSIDATAAGLGPDGEAWRRSWGHWSRLGRACATTCWRRRTCRAIRFRMAKFGLSHPFRARLAEAHSAARAPAPCLPGWPPTPPCRSKRRPAPPRPGPRHRRTRRRLALSTRRSAADQRRAGRLPTVARRRDPH